MFAHVRAASLGSVVTESNCHPFAHGPYMFMHNGCVTSCCVVLVCCGSAARRALTTPPYPTPHRFLNSFSRIRRNVLAYISNDAMDSLRGTTDSEHWCACHTPRPRLPVLVRTHS